MEHEQNWLQHLADVVMHEKELADMPSQLSDDEINSLKRRAKPMGVQTSVEVQRTPNEVRLVVGVGNSKTTYKLTAGLAKSLGEDLFKEGCNLETVQANRSA